MEAEKIEQVLDENAQLRAEAAERQDEIVKLREHVAAQEREIAAMQQDAQHEDAGTEGPADIRRNPLCWNCEETRRARALAEGLAIIALWLLVLGRIGSKYDEWRHLYFACLGWTVKESIAAVVAGCIGFFKLPLRNILILAVIFTSTALIPYLWTLLRWHWRLARYEQPSKLTWLYNAWHEVLRSLRKIYTAFRNWRESTQS